jgi:hypothetical protein
LHFDSKVYISRDQPRFQICSQSVAGIIEILPQGTELLTEASYEPIDLFPQFGRSVAVKTHGVCSL